MGGCDGGLIGTSGARTSEASGCRVLPEGDGCSAECTEYAQSVKAGAHITAGNGVTVVVTDVFTPVDGDPNRDGVICLDFYVKTERLNDRYICLTDPAYAPLQRCQGRTFSDYGVKVHFWSPQGEMARLQIGSYPGIPAITSPLDLYQACKDLGHQEGGCPDGDIQRTERGIYTPIVDLAARWERCHEVGQ